MFVDIAIDIGNVIISCGAVIVTCDYGFFLFDFFLRQKQKKKSKKKKSAIAGYCYRKTRRNFSPTFSQDSLISFM